LSELVQGESGSIVPYGGNPWNLDLPDINSLAEAAYDVISQQAVYRKGARSRAEEIFGLDRMVEGYLGALNL
jgi:hypothetical protein